MLKGQTKKDYQRKYMRLWRKSGKLARYALEERQARDRALLDPLLDPVQPRVAIYPDDTSEPEYIDAPDRNFWLDADPFDRFKKTMARIDTLCEDKNATK